MILTVNGEHGNGYDVVGQFVEEYAIAKANEEEDGIVLVAGTFIVTMYPTYEWEKSYKKDIPYKEVLEIGLNGELYWSDDWWEGQPIVDVVGITPLEEVEPYWRM